MPEIPNPFVTPVGEAFEPHNPRWRAQQAADDMELRRRHGLTKDADLDKLFVPSQEDPRGHASAHGLPIFGTPLRRVLPDAGHADARWANARLRELKDKWHRFIDDNWTDTSLATWVWDFWVCLKPLEELPPLFRAITPSPMLDDHLWLHNMAILRNGFSFLRQSLSDEQTLGTNEVPTRGGDNVKRYPLARRVSVADALNETRVKLRQAVVRLSPYNPDSFVALLRLAGTLRTQFTQALARTYRSDAELVTALAVGSQMRGFAVEAGAAVLDELVSMLSMFSKSWPKDVRKMGESMNETYDPRNPEARNKAAYDDWELRRRHGLLKAADLDKLYVSSQEDPRGSPRMGSARAMGPRQEVPEPNRGDGAGIPLADGKFRNEAMANAKLKFRELIDADWHAMTMRSFAFGMQHAFEALSSMSQIIPIPFGRGLNFEFFTGASWMNTLTRLRGWARGIWNLREAAQFRFGTNHQNPFQGDTSGRPGSPPLLKALDNLGDMVQPFIDLLRRAVVKLHPMDPAALVPLTENLHGLFRRVLFWLRNDISEEARYEIMDAVYILDDIVEVMEQVVERARRLNSMYPADYRKLGEALGEARSDNDPEVLAMHRRHGFNTDSDFDRLFVPSQGQGRGRNPYTPGSYGPGKEIEDPELGDREKAAQKGNAELAKSFAAMRKWADSISEDTTLGEYYELWVKGLKAVFEPLNNAFIEPIPLTRTGVWGDLISNFEEAARLFKTQWRGTLGELVIPQRGNMAGTQSSPTAAHMMRQYFRQAAERLHGAPLSLQAGRVGAGLSPYDPQPLGAMLGMLTSGSWYLQRELAGRREFDQNGMRALNDAAAAADQALNRYAQFVMQYLGAANMRLRKLGEDATVEALGDPQPIAHPPTQRAYDSMATMASDPAQTQEQLTKLHRLVTKNFPDLVKKVEWKAQTGTTLRDQQRQLNVILKALARNPNLPLPILKQLIVQLPGEAAENPSLFLHGLENQFAITRDMSVADMNKAIRAPAIRQELLARVTTKVLSVDMTPVLRNAEAFKQEEGWDPREINLQKWEVMALPLDIESNGKDYNRNQFAYIIHRVALDGTEVWGVAHQEYSKYWETSHQILQLQRLQKLADNSGKRPGPYLIGVMERYHGVTHSLT